MANVRKTLLVIAALGVLSAACGTRRSDGDFLTAGGASNVDQGDSTTPGGVETLAPGQTAAPGTSAGPAVTTTTGPFTGPSGGPSGGPTAGPGGKANYASDIGVTASTITIGNIRTEGGPFGPDQFTPSFYGAAAFFQDINARGGIHGRKVIFKSCDDGGSGSQNQTCAHTLIDNEKVFALAGNNIFVYDGASYVNSKGVPDIGGEPIGIAYYTYPHLYDIFGEGYPRDGKTGWKGQLYGGTEVYHFYKTRLGVKRAGIVYYNQASSIRFGKLVAASLKAEGFEFVKEYEVSLALPNFDSVVVDMRNNRIDAVWDGMDQTGNQSLCQSMNSNNYVPKVKASTVSTFSQTIGSAFEPPCRDHIYVDAKTRPYYDTSNPEIAKFRAAMARYFPDRESKMHEWSVEGWAAAQWFTDAAESCGADLTRKCVEAWLNQQKPPVAGAANGGRWYTNHGLFTTRDFFHINYDTTKNYTDCVDVSNWQVDHWVEVGNMDRDCFTTPYIHYAPE